MSKAYKVALALAFVVLLLGLVIFSRNTLLIKLTNHYFLPPAVTLDCVEFTLNWQLDIAVEKVCLRTPSFTLQGSKLSWQRRDNTLRADYIAIDLLPSEQSSTTSIPTLPKDLPLINIQTLAITSPVLNETIRFKVAQSDRHKFTLFANWQASLYIEEGKVSGDIRWTLADIKALGLAADFSAIGPEQMHSPIASHFSFDGDILATENTLNIRHNMSFKDCQLELSVDGAANISTSLNSKSAHLDLSQLEFQIQIPSADCTALQGIPAELRSSKFQMSLSDPLLLTADKIQTSSLKLLSLNGPSVELQLLQLDYGFTGQAQADFRLDIQQPGKLTLRSGGILSLRDHELQLDSKNILQVNHFTQQDISLDELSSDFALTYTTNIIELTGQAATKHLQLKELQMAIDDIKGNFSLKHAATSGLSLSGGAAIKQVERQTLLANEINSKFSVSGPDVANLDIVLDTRIGQLSQGKGVISVINNQMSLKLENQNRITGKGDSRLGKLTIQGLNLADLRARHMFSLDVVNQQLSSEHNIAVNNDFSLGLQTDNYLARIEVKNQAITALTPFSKQYAPQLSLLAGQLSANIQARLDTLTAKGNISLDDVTVSYDDILVSKLHYAPTLIYDSAILQFQPAMLQIESVKAGVAIEHVSTSIEGTLDQLTANKITLNLFDGSAGIERFYLDGRDQQFEVTVNNLDLARLLELEKQSGIEVNGHLAGNLPITINNGAIAIVRGRLYNQHDGSLRIKDNAAFSALKAQQANLSKKLSLLEQLNFEKLESDVNMDQDGQLKMNIAIVGFNPVAKEWVNFNYGHDENVLVLLRALRLTDSLSKKLEQNIQNH